MQSNANYFCVDGTKVVICAEIALYKHKLSFKPVKLIFVSLRSVTDCYHKILSFNRSIPTFLNLTPPPPQPSNIDYTQFPKFSYIFIRVIHAFSYSRLPFSHFILNSSPRSYFLIRLSRKTKSNCYVIQSKVIFEKNSIL